MKRIREGDTWSVSNPPPNRAIPSVAHRHGQRHGFLRTQTRIGEHLDDSIQIFPAYELIGMSHVYSERRRASQMRHAHAASPPREIASAHFHILPKCGLTLVLQA
jgi:hypothetical protein